MSLKNYQEEVDKWAQQFETPYWNPLEIMSRLIEEVGEVARELNHIYGPKKKKPKEEVRELGEEIGDIILTLIFLANSHNINLDEELEKVLHKLQIRDTHRYKKK